MVKLIYPDGNFDKNQIKEILEYALIGRRRVKEQLKKIGGMEFFDVHFSFIDKETLEEIYVSVPEMSSGKIIPEGLGKPGHLYFAGKSDTGMLGIYKLENQIVSGSGKFVKNGLGNNRNIKENVDIAFRYFTANAKNVSASISTQMNDFLLSAIDIQGIGMSEELTIAEVIALFSASIGKPTLESLVILGNMTVGGTINKIEQFADIIQICVDAGGKKILIPATSIADLYTVPQELLVKIQPIFYSDPIDAVFKALMV